MKLTTLGAAALFALAATGCDQMPSGDGGGAEEVRRLATIEFYEHRDVGPLAIEVPAEVQRGADVPVKVTSYGGGCTARGDTETAVQGLTATVTAYDLDMSGMNDCTDELRFHQHVAVVRFEQAGTARVVVRGRREPGDEPISVERTVVVR